MSVCASLWLQWTSARKSSSPWKPREPELFSLTNVCLCSLVSASSSACISDQVLTKEQRQTFVKLNSAGSRGFHGDDLLRALVHCNHNEAQTDALLLRNRAWLDLVKPKQVTPAQLGASLQAGALSLGGVSRCGWPIVELQVERWQPDEPYATEKAREELL